MSSHIPPPKTVLSEAKLTVESSESSVEQILSDFAADKVASVSGDLPPGSVIDLITKYRKLLALNPKYPKVMHAVLSVLERIESVAMSDGDLKKKPGELWKKLGVGRQPSPDRLRDYFIAQLVNRKMLDDGRGTYESAIAHVAGITNLSVSSIRRIHSKRKSLEIWDDDVAVLESVLSRMSEDSGSAIE